MTKSALKLQPDERLVNLAGQGHEAAFETIVERYQRPLISHCRRLVGADLAQDAVQQTFTSAHAKILEGDGLLHLRAWLYKVAANTAITTLRRRDTSCQQLDSELEGSEQPERVVERTEEVNTLLKRLSRLPERERHALLLKEAEGKGFNQIAAVLGSTPTGAKQLVYRARRRLREACGLFVPAPVLRWLLERQGEVAVTHERLTELVAGGSGTGVLVKAGVAMLLVGAPGAGVGVLLHKDQTPTADVATTAQAASPTRAPASSTASRRDHARSGRRHRSGGASVPAATGVNSAPDPSRASEQADPSAHHKADPDLSAKPARKRTGPPTWSDGLVSLSDWGETSGSLGLDTTQGGQMLAVWRSPDGASDRVRVAYGKADEGLSIASLSSPGARVGEPRITADEQGGGLVAWQETYQDKQDSSSSIVYAARAPGADFGAPARLARLPSGSSADSLKLAENARGEGLAVWLERSAGDADIQSSIVRTAFRPAGGVFEPAQTVSSGGEQASQPVVAISENGGALVAWTASGGDQVNRRVELATIGGRGTLEQVSTISDANASDPAIAFDANGSATIAWTEGVGRDAKVVGTTSSRSGALATTRLLSSPSLRAGDARVAAAPHGGTIVTWLANIQSSPAYRIQATVREPGGTLDAGATISDLSTEKSSFDVAADADGNWLVVWDTTNGFRRAIRAAYRPAGGEFMPFETLASGKLVTEPRLSVDGEGTTIVIWRNDRQLVARYR